jgi:hypothetical protein
MEFNYEYARVNEVNNGVVWRVKKRAKEKKKWVKVDSEKSQIMGIISLILFFSTIFLSLSLLLAL